MPTIGQRSTHDCADCGRPMYWSEGAVRTLSDGAVELGQTLEFVDAYRCASGHTSQQCPVCGSYDTAAWRDTEHLPHYHVICAHCGNDSIVSQ